ncbi:MAG TPA: IPT/TIG domain-containing protein [Candidatus Acidoferrales bacterium]|nr:IPT/TIG domain-containing protein [Candidatus Acidoferrales bacterium]
MASTLWPRNVLIAAIFATSGLNIRAQLSMPAVSPQSTIVLPLELAAGQPATLTVLSPAGRIVPGIKLVLSDGEVAATDESGRAHFLAPREAGILIARIPGTETRAAADVVVRTNAADVEIRGVPAVISLKDRFTINGTGFQGDADRNHIELGGKPAFVLAASPTELVILASPQIAPGKVKIVVRTGTREASTELAIVEVASDALHSAVKPGKTVKLVLHVRGTEQPVDLDVQNMSPGIARFKHGEREHLRTSGGADNSVGIEVKGMRPGEFSYAVSFRPSPGMANADAARDFLQAARRLAKGDERKRIDKVLAKLGPRKTDIAEARKEFAKIPAANSDSDFQAMIRAACEALNGQ